MDTSRFDNQISEVGKQLEGLKKDLESTTGEFIEEAKKIASTWAEMNVRSAFKERPEISLSMGRDRVLEMKAALVAIIRDELPNAIGAALSQDHLWPHRAQKNRFSSIENLSHISIISKALPSHYETAITMGLCKVGDLLVRYGYLDERNDVAGWKFPPHGPLTAYGSALEYYEEQYGLFDPLVKIARKYENTLNILNSSMEKIRQVIASKNEAQAQDLWDNA